MRCLALLALLTLAACSTAEPVWAPDVEVERYSYSHDGQPKLTLFTVVSTKNGSGGHTGLMIDASERVLFDPAGTFRLAIAPERNDVLYGFSPRVESVYVDYHARETFDVIRQEIAVSPRVAEMALREVQGYGAVPKARCSIAISRVLGSLPGFEGFPVTYLPNGTREAFARYGAGPGQTISDDDADDNHGVLMRAAERELVPAEG